MAATKTTTRKKPSGVKGSSSAEGSQNRSQNARLERLETAVRQLARGEGGAALNTLEEER